MNLVIDVGNTQVKAAVFQQSKIIGQQNFPLEEWTNQFKKIIQKHPEIKQGILASVQNLDSKLISLLQEKIYLLVLNASTKVPFTNNYGSPDTLGIDRIALVASAQLHSPNKNVLVIDAGTCITYDFLNSEKEYLGGAISPGLQMRAKAMNNFTAKLPLVEISENNLKNNFIGKTTKECLTIGVLQATAFEIDGFIEAYKNKFDDLTVILTGGDHQILAKRVKNSIFAPANFLLKGLNYILEYNQH